MPAIQEFGVEKQRVPALVIPPATQGGLGLGNSALQFISGLFIPQRPLESRLTSRLEILKQVHFSVAGRTERIARSLAALNQPETLKLTPEEWRFFAEDVDLEDQD